MPTKVELAKFSIRGRVQESSANTFAQSSIQTNLSAVGDQMFIVTGLWTAFYGAALNLLNDYVVGQVTYASQSAAIGPSDPDFIWGREPQQQILTTGGGILEALNYVSVNHFPLATPTIYIGVMGNGQASVITFDVKIEGYMQKVSTTDFFRIANLR